MTPGSPAPKGSLHLRVTDEQGKPTPFRAEWRSSADRGWLRHWSDTGEAELDISAGAVSLLVRRGLHFDAVRLQLDVIAGEVCRQEVVLRRRFEPRELGWWGGENHMHVLHGPKDPPATFQDGARMAAGDALDYIQFAYGWDQSMQWRSAAELEAQSLQASNSEVSVGWNVETPKAYFGVDDGGKEHNVHCLGHGWTVGLKDISRGHAFFHSGPNFRVLQEVRRQGGIVGAAHPVRYWFSPRGNFVSNWASELPFDFVAGVPYAAVDILNDSPLLFFESEQMWYTLLNLGYKVAGTGNSDGAVGLARGVGRFRTYARIEGEFTWEKLAASISRGEVLATSGPFAILMVDGQHAGSEFPADGRTRHARLRAWSSPLPDETLVAVQLVRNGQIVRVWDLRELRIREWEGEFELADREFAWYAVRVLSTCRDPGSVELWGKNVCELAVVSPVYFLPAGFERPRPEPATVQLEIRDEAQSPIPASVIVRDGDAVVGESVLPDGKGSITVPATSDLVIEAPGRIPEQRNLFLDSPELFAYCRNMGSVWPSIYSPETYSDIRRMLRGLRFSVTLQPAPQRGQTARCDSQSVKHTNGEGK